MTYIRLPPRRLYLRGNGLDREPAVTAPLFVRRDVQAPQSGAEVVLLGVVLEVDVQEGHQEADEPVAVQDEPGPGDCLMHVRLGEGRRDRLHQMLLVGPDPEGDRGIDGVGGDLGQPERSSHAETVNGEVKRFSPRT